MVYYSRLPYVSIGPFSLGAQPADNVGLCDTPDVMLTDDGRCVGNICSIFGATRNGNKCVATGEQLCAMIPGTTFAEGECDHETVTKCQALREVPTFTVHPGGGCSFRTEEALCGELGGEIAEGICTMRPVFKSALDSLCDPKNIVDGRCMNDIDMSELCGKDMKFSAEVGICQIDFQSIIASADT